MLRTKVKELGKTLSTLEKELSSIETRAESLREVIHSEEDSIFAEFCERIGVDDIREYEEKQLRGAQEDHAQMLKYETQLARLDTQCASSLFLSSSLEGRSFSFLCRISFNRDQLATIQERHESLQKTVTAQQALLDSSKEEKEAKQAEIEALEQEVEELRESWEESKRAWEEKNQELEDVKKSNSKATKALDKALKDIATCVGSLSLLCFRLRH